MDIEEFEDLVDRYGEDLAAWPPALQAPATALVRDSALARAAITEAQQLRRALAGPAERRAPAGLANRIITAAGAGAAAAAVPAVAPGRLRQALRLMPGIVLPLCFLIGLASGLLPPRSEPIARLDLPTFFLGCCGAGNGNE
jgi:hypothetical protein